ncbi:hypothetical protein BBAD15_g2118 [Beauveria bassiana D1-5]|uniref:Uncharacterized protein n=1 Tax=Beauveria bassiana D1-5 TaxID=1245745 RepID=A0A0A2WGA9_BEABA|nr:hypothetical protein BBAD15_g2118 [Beauveria bassiana D1-5]
MICDFRHFNHIFFKRLWRCLEFDDLNKHCFTDEERRGIILQSPSLQHTRILIYNIYKLADKYRSDLNQVFQEWVAELAELVRKLPNLESIVAHELDVSDDVMLALSNTASLKSLVLHFTRDIQAVLLRRANPELDEYDTEAMWHGRPCCILPPFENLTRLTLLDIFGELSYWLDWITDLLCQSPSLELLSFSIGTLTRWAIEDEMSGSSADPPYRTFFSDLCNRYSNQSIKQLKLRSLRLPSPIRCPDLPTLSKLTDTTYLEDIYVDISQEREDHALAVLSPDATPSLRRLTLKSISRVVLESFWERPLVTDRRLSIFSLIYLLPDNRRAYYSPLAESAPSIGFFSWRSPRDAFYWRGNNYYKNIGLCLYGVPTLNEQLKAGKRFPKLCKQLNSMGSLEGLWLKANTEIKSHASITPTEACNVQCVLSKLAAACRRLHYVKIDRLAWRIHPKVRHTKHQVCTFEEIDAWEAAAEGPAAFCCPEPLGRDVVHEDW